MRIIIFDLSHNFRRELTKELLPLLPEGSLIESSGDPSEGLEKIALFHPDIVLINHANVAMRVNDDKLIHKIQEEGKFPIVSYGIADKSKVNYSWIGITDYLEKKEDNAALLARDFINATKHMFVLKNPLKAEPQPRMMQPGATLTRARWKKDKEARQTKTNPMEALQVAREIASSIAKSRNIETATDSPPPKGSVDLIAIGSSTGGTEALSSILKELHPPLPPIVIAQHIPALFAKLFAERLNDECRLTVQEGEEGLTVKNNNVYIAPGNFHMTVNRESGLIVTHLNTGPKVHSCRPSVDVLFDSVAAFIGKSALGIILTGMGQDGAQGLLKMRKEGSYTLGQDKNTCVVYGMPRAAFDLGAVAKQLPLTAIAGAIEEIAGL